MSNFQFQKSDSDKPDSVKKGMNDISWYYSKTFVWILLLSIGPFGFPWLLKSPKFTRTSKWIIAILILILTLLPFYTGYLLAQLLKNPEDLATFLNMIFTPEDSKLILDFLHMLNN